MPLTTRPLQNLTSRRSWCIDIKKTIEVGSTNTSQLRTITTEGLCSNNSREVCTRESNNILSNNSTQCTDTVYMEVIDNINFTMLRIKVQRTRDSVDVVSTEGSKSKITELSTSTSYNTCSNVATSSKVSSADRNITFSTIILNKSRPNSTMCKICSTRGVNMSKCTMIISSTRKSTWISIQEWNDVACSSTYHTVCCQDTYNTSTSCSGRESKSWEVTTDAMIEIYSTPSTIEYSRL